MTNYNDRRKHFTQQNSKLKALADQKKLEKATILKKSYTIKMEIQTTAGEQDYEHFANLHQNMAYFSVNEGVLRACKALQHYGWHRKYKK